MKKYYLLVYYCFISNIALAGTVGVCFQKDINTGHVLRYISPISLDKDNWSQNGNCLEANLSSLREELATKYIKKKYHIVRTYKNMKGNVSTFESTKMCRLEIEKIGTKISKTRRFGTGRKNQAKEIIEESEVKSSSMILLSSGKRGSFKYNEDFHSIVCRVKHAGNFEIEVYLETGVNKGTLSSTVSLSVGQKFNLGSIVEDLKNKGRTVSINDGIEYSKTKESGNFNYFLKVK